MRTCQRPWTLALSFSLGLLLGGGLTRAARVPESAITLPAASLPEFKTDPFVRESQGNQISGVVRVIHEDRRGRFWFGTQNGLCRYDGSLVYFDLRDAHGQGVTVKAILEDREGILWFGTTGGLTAYDGEFFTSYSEADGLPTADVWCLYQDGEGTLWVGTSYGVCRFDGTAFEPVRLPRTRPPREDGVVMPTFVQSIVGDRSGNLWFAVDGHVLRYGQGAWEALPSLNQGAGRQVTQLLAGRDGVLWLATASRGLLRYDGKALSEVAAPEGSAEMEVGSLYEDRRGALWFSVEGQGVYRYDGEAPHRFSGEGELPGRATFCITQDARARMWFGGVGGVCRADSISVVRVSREGPW